LDEVCFEEGGVVVHTRKMDSEIPRLLAKDPEKNETN
jgi:hypothetical protein